MTSLTWEEFADGLASELPFMNDGDTVVLRHGDYYVQIAQGSDEVFAEAVSNANLSPQDRLTPELESRLEQLGWHRPASAAAGDNWKSAIPWPASTSQTDSLSKRIVRALRDVYGIDSPQLLQYRAWHYTTGRELDWPVFQSLVRQAQ